MDSLLHILFDHNNEKAIGDCIKGIKSFEDIEQRAKRLNAFIEKVENNDADMSIAIGYPSIEVNAKTSGQVTDLKMNTSKEDIFLSCN